MQPSRYAAASLRFATVEGDGRRAAQQVLVSVAAFNVYCDEQVHPHRNQIVASDAVFILPLRPDRESIQ